MEDIKVTILAIFAAQNAAEHARILHPGLLHKLADRLAMHGEAEGFMQSLLLRSGCCLIVLEELICVPLQPHRHLVMPVQLGLQKNQPP